MGNCFSGTSVGGAVVLCRTIVTFSTLSLGPYRPADAGRPPPHNERHTQDTRATAPEPNPRPHLSPLRYAGRLRGDGGNHAVPPAPIDVPHVNFQYRFPRHCGRKKKGGGRPLK